MPVPKCKCLQIPLPFLRQRLDEAGLPAVERCDDRHIALFLDGDLVTGIERQPTDPKSDR